MTLVEEFASADHVEVDWIKIDYSIDANQPFGYGNSSGSGVAWNICLAKTTGPPPWDMVCNAAQLGLPGSNYQVHLSGKPIADPTPAGRELVQWSIDDHPQNLTYQGINVDHIYGTLTTVLTRLAPPVNSTACDAVTRLAFIILSVAMDFENKLTASFPVPVAPSDGTLTVKNIDLSGSASANISLDVSIIGPSNAGCKVAVRQGQSYKFCSIVRGDILGQALFEWTVSGGGQIIGAANQPCVTVQMPNSVATVDIIVQVSFAGSVKISQLVIHLISDEMVQLEEAICRYVHSVERKPPFRIPLGDPAEKYAIDPLSHSEIGEIRRQVLEVVRIGSEVASLAGRILGK